MLSEALETFAAKTIVLHINIKGVDAV